jgi:hypothetical protein
MIGVGPDSSDQAGMVGGGHDTLGQAGTVGGGHDSLAQAWVVGGGHDSRARQGWLKRDGLRGHDSLDQAGMVGGGHDGDFPQQHLGGLAVQHGFVYDLDGHAFWKQRYRVCILYSHSDSIYFKRKKMRSPT